MASYPGNGQWHSKEELVAVAEGVEEAFREHGLFLCLNDEKRSKGRASRHHIPTTLAQYPLGDATPPEALCNAAGRQAMPTPYKLRSVHVFPEDYYDDPDGANGWCVNCLNVLLDQPPERVHYLVSQPMDMTDLPDDIPVWTADGDSTVQIAHTDAENCPHAQRADGLERHDSVGELDDSAPIRTCNWCRRNGPQPDEREQRAVSDD